MKGNNPRQREREKTDSGASCPALALPKDVTRKGMGHSASSRCLMFTH